MLRRSALSLLAALALLAPGTPARTSPTSDAPPNVTIAYQPGISYTTLIVMKQRGTLEKQFPGTKFDWRMLSNGATIRDGFLAGQIQIGAGGSTPFLIGWDRGVGYRLIAAMNEMNLWLMSKDPKIKSVKDLTANSKVGVPGPDAIQAVALRKAAQDQLGNAHALDTTFVAIQHPLGLQSLEGGQLDAHFTSPPFQQEEQDRGAHVVYKSYAAFGVHDRCVCQRPSALRRCRVSRDTRDHQVHHDASGRDRRVARERRRNESDRGTIQKMAERPRHDVRNDAARLYESRKLYEVDRPAYQSADLDARDRTPGAERIGRLMNLGVPLVHAENVVMAYPGEKGRSVIAVEAASFDVHAGEKFVIIGPSGCGKTTLLKAIAGFMQPASGRITVNGKPLERPGPDRAVVFQDFDQLFPWRTVRDNVVYALRAAKKMNPRDARTRADEVLALVDISRAADRYPHQLSGGMKQRAAIARAVALEPTILLMDEPFGALDAITRNQLQIELNCIWERTGVTLILVTHSIQEAIYLGHRVMVMSTFPARVREIVDTSGVDDPSDDRFAELTGHLRSLLVPAVAERAPIGAGLE